MKKIKIGDWVRYYRNGVLVIGVVQYVQKPESGFTSYRIDTDQGSLDSTQVLEVRSL